MDRANLSGARVAVTGGAGFIGSHLVRRLVQHTNSVLVLDNLRRGSAGCVVSPAEFRRLDIRDAVALRAALSGIDVVFHLAAQSNVLGAIADLDYSFSTNVVGTFNVLSSCLARGVRRVVFTSSREVYGEPARLPVTEFDPLDPKNAYGASKASGELYCRVFAAQGLDTVILRLANVYGPGDRDRVIPLFVQRAITGEPLIIYGSGKVLDFVAIDRVVDALLTAATRAEPGTVVNIGSGRGTSIEELAERVLILTASSSTIERAAPRSVEVERFIADINLAKRALGYVPDSDPLCALPSVVNWETKHDRH